MSTEATVTMLLGMLAVWGGLTGSVLLTLRRARRREHGDRHPPSDQ